MSKAKGKTQHGTYTQLVRHLRGCGRDLRYTVGQVRRTHGAPAAGGQVQTDPRLDATLVEMADDARRLADAAAALRRRYHAALRSVV